MSNADPRGRFVWHELLTSDTAGAGAFYPKVVSWKSQPWERNPSYTLWVTEAGPIGGVATLDQGEPHWLPYIAVEDVHAAVAQAKSMGARVVKDVTDMPEVGTYAVLADQQGAEFAVYKSHQAANGSAAPGMGQFSWHELCTSDAEAAVSFYSKLCGWGIGPKHDMGPEFGKYHLMLQDGNQYVGIFQSSKMPPAWMCYVKVDDVDAAADAAKSAGGRVINGPMEVPGGSWIAQILDPAGVAFAVHEEKVAAQAAAAKPPKPKARKAPKPKAEPAAEKPAVAVEAPAPKQMSAPAAEKPAKAAASSAPAKAAARKAPAKEAAAKTAPAKKAPAKKAAAKKAAGKAAKKAKTGKAAKKAPAKAVAKKAPGKKSAGKKAAKKKAAPMKKKAAAKKARKRR